MSHKNTLPGIIGGVIAGIGVAAGAVLAAGLIPLATSPIAHADGDDSSPSADTDFIDHVTNFGLFTDVVAADPDDEFTAMVISNPLFTDVLTSGVDPSDALADLGAPGDTGIGVAGETINTFESSVFPFLDSTIVIPFTNPFADLFTELIPIGL